MDNVEKKLADVQDLVARYLESLDKCRACDYYVFRKKLREFAQEKRVAEQHQACT
jgi:hypothetical protein